MFALVDCNNFYASCERVFNPHLQDQAIVVLSNNDGCVIARSAQAKQLGIPMGVPYFKIARLCQHHQVKIFSSNYALYGDMSRRVMDILHTAAPQVEIYSIDEAFLQYGSQPLEHLLKDAQQLQQKILQWTGLPTCIGIAPTKTLAKVANHIAKKETAHGVIGWRHAKEWEPILARLALTDIWGIGARSAVKLHSLGINTPLALAQAPLKWIRQHGSVVMERIVYELNGTPCYGLESVKPRQQIMASRSFGYTVTTLPDLIAAACEHAARAFVKLREQRQLTTHIHVFLTQAFQDNKPGDTQRKAYRFNQPTQDTRHACHAVTQCVRALFTPGKSYKKVGVLLADLMAPNYQTQDLFMPKVSSKNSKAPALMATLDQINQRLGSNTLFIAGQGIEQPWKMRATRRSPCYTTRWDQLVTVQ